MNDASRPASGSASARPRPAARTSAWPAPRCSTGRSRATTAAPSSSASRTPTRRATPRSPTTSLLEVMRWLGLDWDEGPEVGGPHAPYRQSERTRHLRRRARRGCATAAFTYDCYCTTDEVDARRKASRLQGAWGTTASAASSTDEQVAAFEAEGRQPVVRFRMPDGEITFDDLVRGEITFQTEHVPDFALARANGDPLYTLVNPVDDALMEITHVLRGEDLLSSTPRQIALYDALVELGIAERHPAVRPPALRDGRGQQEALQARPAGAPARLPRAGLPARGAAQLPRPARLGDRRATATSSRIDEMVAAFDIGDVNPNPARFDLKKAEAINAAHMRLLPLEDMTDRVAARSSARGRRRRPGRRRRRAAARAGDAAGRRADEQAHRGRRHARLPVRRRGRRSTRRSTRARRRRARRSCRRRTTRSPGSRSGRPPRSRRRCASRWSRSSGSSRATPSARCGSRSPAADLAAAVRVPGAARSRAEPRPARGARSDVSAPMTEDRRPPGTAPGLPLPPAPARRSAAAGGAPLARHRWCSSPALIVVAPLLLLLPFALVVRWSTGSRVLDGMTGLLDLDRPDAARAGLPQPRRWPRAIPVTWFARPLRCTACGRAGCPRCGRGCAGATCRLLRARRSWRCSRRCVVSALLPAAGRGAEIDAASSTTSPRRPATSSSSCVLLTPLQAAGEEYAFRGYLTQAFGGLFRRRRWRARVVGSGAAVRARARRSGRASPIFFDRFAFGLVAGILVIAHRRPRGRHRDARAQQLAGLRPRARLRRHGHRRSTRPAAAGGASR